MDNYAELVKRLEARAKTWGGNGAGAVLSNGVKVRGIYGEKDEELDRASATALDSQAARIRALEEALDDAITLLKACEPSIGQGDCHCSKCVTFHSLVGRRAAATLEAKE